MWTSLLVLWFFGVENMLGFMVGVENMPAGRRSTFLALGRVTTMPPSEEDGVRDFDISTD